MRKRPLALTILALIHFLYPVYYFILVVHFHNISIVDFFDLVNVLFNPFQRFLFFFLSCAPIVLGYGLFKVRAWAYGFFFVYAACTIVLNGAHWIKFGEGDLIPPMLDISIIFITLFFTFYFVRKHIRRPYFNPRLRWWENDDRYKVEDMYVKIEDPSNEDHLFEDGEVFDLSENGLFIRSKFVPVPGVTLRVTFRFLEENLSVDGKVMRIIDGTGRNPKGFGLLFVNLPGRDKKRIRSFLNLLDEKRKR